jgi:hypothetical protein
MIYAYLIFDGNDSAAINQLIETQAGYFLRAQTMAVQKNQGAIIDVRQVPQDRMLVPMRWIVNITADVFPLVGELSETNEQGVEVLKDGTEPIKQ